MSGAFGFLVVLLLTSRKVNSMSAEIEQKIADIRATLTTLEDLQDVAVKLFGDQTLVLLEKDSTVVIMSQLFARGGEQRLVIGPTDENLNGEE